MNWWAPAVADAARARQPGPGWDDGGRVNFAELAATSAAVRAVASRSAKIGLLAEALRRLSPDEIEAGAAYLTGEFRQRQTGVGWATLRDPPTPAGGGDPHRGRRRPGRRRASPRLSGPGSQEARAAGVRGAVCSAGPPPTSSVAAGFLRRGPPGRARAALVQEAVAAASGVSWPRYAAPHDRRWPRAGRVAAMTGGGELCRAGLEVGPPVLPMLASSAPDGRGDGQGRRPGGGRHEARRHPDPGAPRGDDVRSPPAASTTSPSGCPRWSRSPGRCRRSRARARRRGDRAGRRRPAAAVPGDRVPHGPGSAGAARSRRTSSTCSTSTAATSSTRPAPSGWRPSTRSCPRSTACRGWSPTTPPTPPQAFAGGARRRPRGRGRQEPRDRVRRRSSRRGWVKVKPVHTLDLVVLAVEWGSGRRQGWLSNIHLGARDPTAPAASSMLGKTFKGMTDEMLAWQTERFTELALEPATIRARTSYRPPSRSSRSPSTASSAPPLPRRPRPALRPGRPLPRRQVRRRGRHHRDRARPAAGRGPGRRAAGRITRGTEPAVGRRQPPWSSLSCRTEPLNLLVDMVHLGVVVNRHEGGVAATPAGHRDLDATPVDGLLGQQKQQTQKAHHEGADDRDHDCPGGDLPLSHPVIGWSTPTSSGASARPECRSWST